MTTQVTVTTEDFTVTLPATMLVGDTPSDLEPLMVIGFIGESDFPWRTESNMYKYVKPIEEPKMIPWTIEDFKVGMVIKSKPTYGTSTTAILRIDSNGIHILTASSISIRSVDHLLEQYTQADGSAFEKESN